jgi:hypothetical protein
MVEDLVQWLRAQLDEDARIARAVTTPGTWRVGSSHGGSTVEGDGWTVGNADELDAAHIARHDPARVLREIDAKRQVLDWYQQRAAVDSRGEDPDDYENVTGSTLETVVQILALPYADRPGYREEWRP